MWWAAAAAAGMLAPLPTPLKISLFISRELTIPLIMSNTNDATLFTMAGADVCIREALKALLSWVPGAPSG